MGTRLPEVLRDILDNTILEVRKHESALLARVAELERDNAALREARARTLGALESLERRRVEVARQEGLLQARHRELAASAAPLARSAARDARKASGPALQPGTRVGAATAGKAPVLPSTALLEYMVRCEEILGVPEGAVRARAGLNETSSPESLQAVLPAHLEELERSYTREVSALKAELLHLGERSESKSAGAAAKMREKKLAREKQQLLQALVTVSNLVSKLLSKTDSPLDDELTTMAKVLDLARASVSD
jgi:hypothetical protein